jgi:hypothetical protein
MFTSPVIARDYQELKDPINWIRAAVVYSVLGTLVLSCPVWLRPWVEYSLVTVVAFAILPQLHELRFVLWLLGAKPLTKKQQQQQQQQRDKIGKSQQDQLPADIDDKCICVLRHLQQTFPFSSDRNCSPRANFFPRDFDPTWGWALSEVLRQMEDRGLPTAEIGNDAKLQLADGSTLHFGDHMCELLDRETQPLPLIVDIILNGESTQSAQSSSGGGSIPNTGGNGVSAGSEGRAGGDSPVFGTSRVREGSEGVVRGSGDDIDIYGALGEDGEEEDWTTKWYVAYETPCENIYLWWYVLINIYSCSNTLRQVYE